MSTDQSKSAEISPAKDGPLIVKNLATFKGPDGEAVSTKPVMALCRCGASKTRPFCDGTHAKVGFVDENDGGSERDDRKTYVGEHITIHDNRGICSHAAHCTNRLSKCFDHSDGWSVYPDKASVDEVIEIVEACPSGALSYSIDGKETRDFDREQGIHIEKHGPYQVRGGVEFEDAPWFDEVSREHYALCRCGHSKNKPFCDGQHWHAKYRDDDKIRVAMLDDLRKSSPTTVEVLGVEVVVSLDDDTPRVRTSDGRELDSEVEKPWDEVLVSRSDLGASSDEAAPEADSDEVEGGTREEPHNNYIRHLAKHGLSSVGHHGRVAAMGVPRYEVPSWDDLQFVTAQLHKVPQLDDAEIDTKLVVGPSAQKPLELEIPLIVSDMSFGALSFEAKMALAKGAELAGTGTCSGEGGMLPEEQEANSRYFYELASARFGFSFEQVKRCQAFHFKLGQGAKTGTGGHLPGCKVDEKIASVRGLNVGQDAISPARFPEWTEVAQFRDFAQQLREETGGIPGWRQAVRAAR